MTKRETIERIMARNPSARPEFLAEFTEEDLSAYLRQLESLCGASPCSRMAATQAWSPAGPAAQVHPGLGG